MSVAEQLQQTPRGRLKYDRRRICLQSIEDVLDEIHSDLDALQLPVVVTRTPLSSPPSFGLSPPEPLDTPLHRPVTRMTCLGPWSPRTAGASPATRAPARDRPASGGGEDGRDISSVPSPAIGRETESGVERIEPRRVERDSDGNIQRKIEHSFGDIQEQSVECSQKLTADHSREQISAEMSQNQSVEQGDTAGNGPKTSTPRGSPASSPLTARTFEKLLHDERQRHLEEAKAAARARLAVAEETVRQLREQHQLRQRQLAAAQQLRGRQQREQQSVQRQRSEQQLRQQQEHIRQQQQLDAKDLSERVQAAVQQQQSDEEERRQRAARQRAKLDQMVAAQKQMRCVVAQVFNSIKGCADRSRLQEGPAAGQVEQLKRLVSVMDRLATGPPAELEVNEAGTTVTEATELADQITAAVDEINSAVSADRAAKEARAAAETAPAQPAGPATTGQSTAAVGTGELLGGVLKEDSVQFEQLQQRAAQFRAQFADLIADPALKKFKFDCQKAVNTPINAISPVSTAHLRDKLERLQLLLRGRPVAVTGGHVSAAAHPHGVAFCLDLVAKKFVRQGEDVVSSKPEAAFALAAVLVALQMEFPVLAELTLAHCQARCPYLVPLYPPQLDGDTDEQYYRKLGYDYVDGVVEKQDKFLKRMSGIARLFVALLIAQPPQSSPAPGPGGRTRPLGAKHLWHWLAAVVNLEPRADVTASILHDALEVAGSTLSALYGAQFVKLVKLISTRYLPRVQQVTPAGCGGPVVRLEQQLQRIITTGRVPPPHGQLKLHNW